MATAKLTRAEQRQAAMRAVLDAAADQFAHYGFEGASLNVIADQSGVSKQNLIYYFGSKDDLWKATVADIFEQVNAEFQANGDRVDRARTLKELTAGYFDIARRYPAYVLIPMIEGINDTWRSRLLAEKYLSPHIAGFEGRVRALVEAGEIVDVPALHLQNLVTGGAQLFLALAPLWAHAIKSDTTSEEFLASYGETVSALLSR